ncbi:MAG: hypothetical protein AB1898_22840 [Acidobacteriota bacterium]
MRVQLYLRTSGVIFGVVALAHLFRLINHWTFQVGPWSLPMWISWFAAVVPALLSLWAFRLSART